MAEMSNSGQEKGDLAGKCTYFSFININSQIYEVHRLFWPISGKNINVKVLKKTPELKSRFAAILDWMVVNYFAAKYAS